LCIQQGALKLVQPLGVVLRFAGKILLMKSEMIFSIYVLYTKSYSKSMFLS
jgi:hypothetical protein